MFSRLFFGIAAQVLTLAKKIRAKWGDFNATEADDSDNPNWGFLNLKKLGHIALGIAKEELRDLPIRGIEDAIDVLGREKDWDRGQVRSFISAVSCSLLTVPTGKHHSTTSI